MNTPWHHSFCRSGSILLRNRTNRQAPDQWRTLHSTHLPRHYGPTTGRTTCRLGLVVPEHRQGCRIALNNRVCHCTDDGFLTLVDTHGHEAWNVTDENRIVLLMDVERRLRQLGKTMAGGLFWLATTSPLLQVTQTALDESTKCR